MNIGVFIFVTQAIYQEKARAVHYLHMFLQLLASLSTTFALYVIWTNKDLSQKPHLTSWHSWIGIAVWTTFIFQGFGSYFSMHPSLKPKDREKTKPVHTSFGRLLYWGLLLSCVMGYARQTDLSLHNVKTYVFVACLLLSVLLGIASRKESVFSKRN
eukprot:TRINITY_DN1382_c0_g2_i7.p1 TRINITY_DN1382_c0_g2~~TRINITY_DN1382_c0_g2_i7.p1  ORF type:complete len:157 (+),score=15.80 TRINITY_DN1382_c0_g2_i7:66-536(+)